MTTPSSQQLPGLNPAFQIQETVPFDMGPEAYEIKFLVEAINAPIGTFLTFISLDYEPTIYLKPVEVSYYPNFEAGVKVSVPAGAKFNFQLGVFRNEQALPPDMEVILSAYLVVGEGQLGELVMKHKVKP